MDFLSVSPFSSLVCRKLVSWYVYMISFVYVYVDMKVKRM